MSGRRSSLCRCCLLLRLLWLCPHAPPAWQRTQTPHTRLALRHSIRCHPRTHPPSPQPPTLMASVSPYSVNVSTPDSTKVVWEEKMRSPHPWVACRRAGAAGAAGRRRGEGTSGSPGGCAAGSHLAAFINAARCRLAQARFLPLAPAHHTAHGSPADGSSPAAQAWATSLACRPTSTTTWPHQCCGISRTAVPSPRRQW